MHIQISANWRARLKTTPFAYDAHVDTLSAEFQYLIDTVMNSLFAVHSYYLHAKSPKTANLSDKWLEGNCKTCLTSLPRYSRNSSSSHIMKYYIRTALVTYIYVYIFIHVFVLCIYVRLCIVRSYNVIVYSALGSKPVERLDREPKLENGRSGEQNSSCFRWESEHQAKEDNYNLFIFSQIWLNYVVIKKCKSILTKGEYTLWRGVMHIHRSKLFMMIWQLINSFIIQFVCLVTQSDLWVRLISEFSLCSIRYMCGGLRLLLSITNVLK